MRGESQRCLGPDGIAVAVVMIDSIVILNYVGKGHFKFCGTRLWAGELRCVDHDSNSPFEESQQMVNRAGDPNEAITAIDPTWR